MGLAWPYKMLFLLILWGFIIIVGLKLPKQKLNERVYQY